MSSRGRIRVAIADDDSAVRGALAALISDEPVFELVGAAADTAEAIELAASARPDVFLVDVRMPHGGGVAASLGIRRWSPATKIIAISAQSDRSNVVEMLEAGAGGYLVKGGSAQEIVEAIKRARDGKGSLSVEVTSSIVDELVDQLGLRSRVRTKRLLLEGRIRHALDNPEAFTMAFQPIARLSDRSFVGAEALARFAGPPMLSPSQWFSDAGVVGLRLELELSAVRKAVEALPDLPANVSLSFNVSPTTLTRDAFHELVARADARRLVAEITEHAPIHDYDQVNVAVDRLRSHGMRLAVDDTGAGFASLRHILRLNPDWIKLDRTLVRNIDRDSSKQALAAGLISFAAKSGSEIIAEGIERASEAQALVQLGVSFGQGYYLCRPGPLPLGSRRKRSRRRAGGAARV